MSRHVTTIALSCLLLAGCAAAGQQESATDRRQRLTLAAELRDGVLAEMRAMLGSVGGVVGSLAAGDTAAAEKAARSSGMSAAVDVDPRLRQTLPPPFLQLGMGTHRGFDALADRLRDGAPRDEVLRSLANLLGNCVQCHATYRLDEAR